MVRVALAFGRLQRLPGGAGLFSREVQPGELVAEERRGLEHPHKLRRVAEPGFVEVVVPAPEDVVRVETVHSQSLRFARPRRVPEFGYSRLGRRKVLRSRPGGFG